MDAEWDDHPGTNVDDNNVSDNNNDVYLFAEGLLRARSSPKGTNYVRAAAAYSIPVGWVPFLPFRDRGRQRHREFKQPKVTLLGF